MNFLSLLDAEFKNNFSVFHGLSLWDASFGKLQSDLKFLTDTADVHTEISWHESEQYFSNIICDTDYFVVSQITLSKHPCKYCAILSICFTYNVVASDFNLDTV